MNENEMNLKVVRNNVVVNTLGAKDGIKQLLNALWLKNENKNSVEIKIHCKTPEVCDVKIQYTSRFDVENGYRFIVENVPLSGGLIDTTKIMILYMN